MDGLRDFKSQELKLLQAIRSQQNYKNNPNCERHKFCQQSIVMLDEQGGDESYPMSHQN